jgi:hypothetical protein
LNEFSLKLYEKLSSGKGILIQQNLKFNQKDKLMFETKF